MAKNDRIGSGNFFMDMPVALQFKEGERVHARLARSHDKRRVPLEALCRCLRAVVVCVERPSASPTYGQLLTAAVHEFVGRAALYVRGHTWTEELKFLSKDRYEAVESLVFDALKLLGTATPTAEAAEAMRSLAGTARRCVTKVSKLKAKCQAIGRLIPVRRRPIWLKGRLTVSWSTRVHLYEPKQNSTENRTYVDGWMVRRNTGVPVHGRFRKKAWSLTLRQRDAFRLLLRQSSGMGRPRLVEKQLTANMPDAATKLRGILRQDYLHDFARAFDCPGYEKRITAAMCRKVNARSSPGGLKSPMANFRAAFREVSVRNGTKLRRSPFNEFRVL